MIKTSFTSAANDTSGERGMSIHGVTVFGASARDLRDALTDSPETNDQEGMASRQDWISS
jgi:hypothetical protein